MRQGAAILLVAALTGPAMSQNRQPISTSLTECGTLFDVVAEAAETRGSRTETEIAEARLAGVRFRAAAVDQARAEGRANPATHISRQGPDLFRKWQGRFGTLSWMQETKDWLDYCNALGRNRGVLPLPD